MTCARIEPKWVRDPEGQMRPVPCAIRFARAEFEKQLEVKERILDERIRVNTDYVGGIDYTMPRVSPDTDVVAAIEACLQETGEPEF